MIRELRDTLLEHREDYDAAYKAFAWPQLEDFNWALDWFDPFARGNDQPGLLVIEQDGSSPAAHVPRAVDPHPTSSRTGCGRTASSAATASC